MNFAFRVENNSGRVSLTKWLTFLTAISLLVRTLVTVQRSLSDNTLGKGMNPFLILFINGLISSECRIHKAVIPPPNECPGYEIKQSHGEVPVILELWGMRSTPSLPSLLGLLWPRVVAPDRVLCIGQIELNCVLTLNWIAWNRALMPFKLRTYAKLNCLK